MWRKDKILILNSKSISEYKYLCRKQPFGNQFHLLMNDHQNFNITIYMKQLITIFVVLLSLSMTSCTKDEAQTSGVGDAIIVTRKIGSNTVYGLTFYAYTFNSFKSVVVSGSKNPSKTYAMKANQGYNTNFYFETPDAEFSTTKPSADTYNFSAVFENGISLNFTDDLSDKALGLPVITKCEYNTSKAMLDVAWNELPDADSYAINIFDGNTIVFGSVELSKTVKTYSISSNGGGWANGFSPVNGKTYKVKVLAFLYEPQVSSYDVQATSFSESNATWGN